VPSSLASGWLPANSDFRASSTRCVALSAQPAGRGRSPERACGSFPTSAPRVGASCVQRRNGRPIREHRGGCWLELPADHPGCGGQAALITAVVVLAAPMRTGRLISVCSYPRCRLHIGLIVQPVRSTAPRRKLGSIRASHRLASEPCLKEKLVVIGAGTPGSRPGTLISARPEPAFSLVFRPPSQAVLPVRSRDPRQGRFPSRNSPPIPMASGDWWTGSRDSRGRSSTPRHCPVARPTASTCF